VKRARIIGVISWTLEVPGVKHSAYRDTRGCGAEGFRKLLESAARQSPKKAARDKAILRLLFDLALRRGEVTGLDFGDVDLETGTLAVKGKGRNNEKELLTLPVKTAEALKNWLEIRGSEPGVLFYNFDHAAKGERLTGRSVDRLVKYLGKRAGLKDVRPHGLRHAAITEALDLTGGDVRKVQRFSRHRDIRTLSLYDDNREDFGGQVASLVSELA
ncbi:MAG: tyrosine-type recombinase/integrase, partial [bacterium]|nr:tyrosine-type recombinase/integrase [bacterium]